VLDIVGKRYWYFGFSLLIIVPGLIAMGMHMAQDGRPFRFAIDFTGGTLLQLKFDKPQTFSTDQVVRAVGPAGLSSNDVQVQTSGTDTLILRTRELDNANRVQTRSVRQSAPR